MSQTEVETYGGRIYLGLRRGYTETLHTVDEVEAFLQTFVDAQKLCVTVEETTFVYTGGKEPGVVVGIIHYPRFPSTKTKIRDLALDLGRTLKEVFGQFRVSVVFPDHTVMLGDQN